MRLFFICCLLAVAGCASIIDVPSQNQNSRIRFLVIHFTSEDFAESLRLLTQRTDRPVSVHYLVPEPGDSTYERRSLNVYRLVPENRRARHAGLSYWAGAVALNDTSIGIEIVNQSACVNNNPQADAPTPEDQNCNFLAFPEEQMKLVIELSADILERNPDIDPVDVIGHGDLAPTRRLDPGPLFPWKRLYENGIGAWFDADTATRYQQRFAESMPDIARVQAALNTYGYKVEVTGDYDVQTRFVLRAFQMHFRPSDFSGKPDLETVANLFALIEKYRSEQLEDLLQHDVDPTD